MIRRHPHVFGAERGLDAGRDQSALGEDQTGGKIRAKQSDPASGESLLADIPLALPGLTRAVKLQAKAATVGFDWNDARLVIEKIREETDEIEAALDSGDAAAMHGEIGDLLFTVANLARHVKADPEAAIRRCQR